MADQTYGADYYKNLYSNSLQSQTQNGTAQNGGLNTNNNQLYYNALAQNNGSGASSLATAQTIQGATSAYKPMYSTSSDALLKTPTSAAGAFTPVQANWTVFAPQNTKPDYSLPTNPLAKATSTPATATATSTQPTASAAVMPTTTSTSTTAAKTGLTNEQSQIKNQLLTQYHTLGNAQSRLDAANKLKQNGWGDDMVSYLKGLVQSGTDQQRQNALGELKAYWGIDLDYMPKGYENLMTTDQIQKYAYDQANQQFQNEKLGYDQLIAQYQQQIDQMDSDEEIKRKSQDYSNLKYADAFVGLENEMNGAKADYDVSYNNINNTYADSIKQLQELANQQKGSNLADASRRGLGNSSILSQTNSIADTNHTKAVAQSNTTLQNNIFALDKQMSALAEGIRNQYTSLTKQQQAEASAMFMDLAKERNQKKSQLELQIMQQNQQINNARNGITSNQNSIYQNTYNKYADLYRQDRNYQQTLADFKAKQDQIARENEQWQKQYQQQQQQIEYQNQQALREYQAEQAYRQQQAAQAARDFAEQQRQFNMNYELSKKKIADQQAAEAAAAQQAAIQKAAQQAAYVDQSAPKQETRSSVSGDTKAAAGLSKIVNDSTYYKYVNTMSKPAPWTIVNSGLNAVKQTAATKKAALEKFAPTYNKLLNAAKKK